MILCKINAVLVLTVQNIRTLYTHFSTCECAGCGIGYMHVSDTLLKG